MYPFKIKILFVVHGGENKTAARDRIYVYRENWVKFGIQAEYFEWHPTRDNKIKDEVAKEIIRISKNFDIIYLFRALLPLKLIKLLKLTNRIIVFDFDDAIYHVSSLQCSPVFKESKDKSERIKRIFRFITRNNKFYSSRHNKLSRVLKLCNAVVCGNNELKKYSTRYCSRYFISPTPIETKIISRKIHTNKIPVVIGWTGTPANTNYLKLVKNVFDYLANKYQERVLIKIVTVNNLFKFNNSRVIVEKWEKEKDKDILTSFDIGIMPLTDDGWARGKCSFKALLCMAAGLPVVISPVGMNSDIVQDGQNGFLADNDKEWITKLETLIDDYNLRAEIGTNAAKYVNHYFSVEYLQNNLSEFLMSIFNAYQQNNKPTA